VLGALDLNMIGKGLHSFNRNKILEDMPKP
jgi:hypothetical protein